MCYESYEDHVDLPHDIDYPIMCHQCNDLPSTCRIKSVLNPDWLYWCYPCYANHEHHEPIEDITYMDLDSASEDGELDEQEHETHSVGGSSSFSSWHLPLSCNLQDLELQSNADTCTEKSFNLVYQVVDNEDTTSMSSFQMIQTTASSVADPDEQQEQQQQQDQEQQQSSVHELVSAAAATAAAISSSSNQPEQEPDVADGGDEASNVADVGSNVADVGDVGDVGSNVGDDDQQPVQASELAKWREEQEILIAIEMSIREQQLQITAKEKAAVADNSNSQCSSSCSSTSSNSMPTPNKLPKKLPKNTGKVQPLRTQSSKQQQKVVRTGLEAIPEVQFDEALQMSEYVDSSGCTQAVFTDESIKESSPVPMCPIHLLDYQPNCRECANHQFFQAKHNHDVQLTQAIEQSMKTSSSKIIYTDGLPCCSMHDDSMQQDCHTCNQVLLLRDELSACSLRMKNLKQ